MIADEPGAPLGGHNSGAMREGALADFRETLQRFADRRDQFVRAASATVVRDRATAGSAADIIKLAGEVWSMIDAERTSRSEPFRDTWLALKGAADDFWRPVVEAFDALNDKIAVWNDAEDARIRAQKAEQDAEMARIGGNAAAAPAPARPLPARPRKIRGDLGATLATTETFDYEVVDVRLVPGHILNSPTVHAAIVKVVRATARHLGNDIPGIRATPVSAHRVI